MISDDKKLIAVAGASGHQDGGVARALHARGEFNVRALTRHTHKYRGLAGEVVGADLNRPETLCSPFLSTPVHNV
jgi:uncharacterized protein YbjT (DUF2867 family)